MRPHLAIIVASLAWAAAAGRACRRRGDRHRPGQALGPGPDRDRRRADAARRDARRRR
jgi:hypothetical protein